MYEGLKGREYIYGKLYKAGKILGSTMEGKHSKEEHLIPKLKILMLYPII